jgi:hypothetical protein
MKAVRIGHTIADVLVPDGGSASGIVLLFKAQRLKNADNRV